MGTSEIKAGLVIELVKPTSKTLDERNDIIEILRPDLRTEEGWVSD